MAEITDIIKRRYCRWGSQKATITTTASGIENSSTWEFRRREASARAQSPVKKIAAYPDPPPNFMLSKCYITHMLSTSNCSSRNFMLSFDRWTEPIYLMKCTMFASGKNFMKCYFATIRIFHLQFFCLFSHASKRKMCQRLFAILLELRKLILDRWVLCSHRSSFIYCGRSHLNSLAMRIHEDMLGLCCNEKTISESFPSSDQHAAVTRPKWR